MSLEEERKLSVPSALALPDLSACLPTAWRAATRPRLFSWLP